MPHPVTKCPEAARLYQQVLDISALHNRTPEVLRIAAIEAEHKGKAWQIAYSLYQSHIQNCDTCKQALKEMEEV